MDITRRQALALSAGAAVFAAAGLRVAPARASAEAAEHEVLAFTGGRTPEPGRITLTLPEVAENGNTVPVSVAVDSAMAEGDMVEAVMIVAEDNPNPQVATFHFTAMSGTAAVATRMRLARSQGVVAVARMADGSVFVDRRDIQVTVGGCGA